MYRVVFDISERIPDALLGVPAVAGLVLTIAVLIRPAWRQAMRRRSGILLAAAALPWMAFTVHNIGGQVGILAGASFGVSMIAGGAFIVAGLGERVKVVETRRGDLSLGTTALAAAAVAFGLVALGAYQQVPAFGLREQLEEGRASVVEGPVEDHMNFNWGYECFTVAGHRFCYDDGPTCIGFHQSRNNGGPIHDGLEVQVTYIGDDIVRLEIADEQ
jgi:hypothetical protein